jgi:hypothetical protein
MLLQTLLREFFQSLLIFGEIFCLLASSLHLNILGPAAFHRWVSQLDSQQYGILLMQYPLRSSWRVVQLCNQFALSSFNLPVSFDI